MVTLNNAFFVVCFGLFAWQVVLILISFARKETSIAIRTEENEIQSKTLPCLTFCPMSGYKNLAEYHTDIKSYLEDTFGKEDIFLNRTLQQFENGSEWLVKELNTISLGRCTMACYKLKVSKIDLSNGPMIALNGSQYQVLNRLEIQNLF
jgi:hypothetical protein